MPPKPFAGGCSGSPRATATAAPPAPPPEAIAPRTLAPRSKGSKTERSEGGPPSTAKKEEEGTRQ
ncbi:DUF6009 family protein [Streptomyces sp. NPDC059909]|uniref:DUF6009 family protein n=1 Tax=Streptomyces sp. NPDC059909 TaxID=3346998 RepID=UPI003653D542